MSVTRVTDSETTLCVNSQYEVTLRDGVPMTVTKHYSFSGQRIAMRLGQGPFTYLHPDHLGSTLAATDSTGTVLSGNQPRYYANGAERVPSIANLPTSYTYTGQRRDAGSGLMYYGARYYNSGLGTLVQPDTVVPQPSNPQNLNR
jgi:RHS repeat-associated protein